MNTEEEAAILDGAIIRKPLVQHYEAWIGKRGETVREAYSDVTGLVIEKNGKLYRVMPAGYFDDQFLYVEEVK